MVKLFCLLLSSLPLFGTTYYVSSTGNNANAGTSSAAPWQTVAFLNGKTFVAGDHILFKMGDTWSGSTTFGVTLGITRGTGGTVGNEIVFDSYGTGAKPFFDGLNTLGTAVNITVPGIIIQNLSFARVSGDFISVNSSNDKILNNTFKDKGSHVVYMHSGSTLLFQGNSYTTSPGHNENLWVVRTHNNNNVTVRGNNWDLRTVNNGSSAGVDLAGGTGGLIENNIMHGGCQGVSFKPAVGSDNATPSGPPQTDGMIRNNYIDVVTDVQGTCVYGGCCDGEAIELEGAPLYLQSNIIVQDNIVVCKAGGSNGGTSDAIGGYFTFEDKITGNIMIGDCGAAPHSGRQDMIHLATNGGNSHVIGNTAYGAKSSVSAAVFLAPNTELRNNIFAHFAYSVANSASGSSDDYNMWYDVTNMFPSGLGWTLGPHSTNGIDPGFADPTPSLPNDLKLLDPGSPALTGGLFFASPYDIFPDPADVAPIYGNLTVPNTMARHRGGWPKAQAIIPPPPPPPPGNKISIVPQRARRASHR